MRCGASKDVTLPKASCAAGANQRANGPGAQAGRTAASGVCAAAGNAAQRFAERHAIDPARIAQEIRCSPNAATSARKLTV
jgi:hypothetical protein